MNILFTCAGRRNYLINYFKTALNGEGKVFAVDSQLTAPAMKDADVAIEVPSIYAKNYIEVLLDIAKKNKITAIISLNDLELPILSESRHRFEKLGVNAIVSNKEVIDIAFDKWETVRFLSKLNLLTPKTFINLHEAKKAIVSGELEFPLVLKPRWGSASIGIDYPENLKELELSYELQSLRLKKTILSEASKEDIDHAILIQEKLKGDEYGMDILNDFEGNYSGTFVRKKLAMRGGETDKAISVINIHFEEIGKLIGENLMHIGNMDCDVFEVGGKLYVLELNPRFGGGYPFSHEAGMNTAAVYIEWLKGNKKIDQFNNYQEGLMFSKYDKLMKVN